MIAKFSVLTLVGKSDYNVHVELALSVLTAIATLIGIAVAIRTRQLSRPTLRVHLGTLGLEQTRGPLARRRRKRLLIYGLPPISRDYFVVPIGIPVENLSSLPITSLRLLLSYPAECLLDNSTIVDEQSGPHDIGSQSTPGRVAKRYGALAQVSFHFDILRPKEKMIVHELLRIPRNSVPATAEDPHQASLARQWQNSDGFCSSFHMQVTVWAANCDPGDATGIVIAVEASQEKDLTRRSKALVEKIWGSQTPIQGIRALLQLRQKRPSMELAELVFLTKDAFDGRTAPEIDPTILKGARTALLAFPVPPWGFTAEISDEHRESSEDAI